jgi:hypothetical protein
LGDIRVRRVLEKWERRGLAIAGPTPPEATGKVSIDLRGPRVNRIYVQRR